MRLSTRFDSKMCYVLWYLECKHGVFALRAVRVPVYISEHIPNYTVAAQTTSFQPNRMPCFVVHINFSLVRNDWSVVGQMNCSEAYSMVF